MKRTEKVLLIVFLVVTLICGKYLLDYWQDSYENRQNYRQVEEIAFPEKDTEEDGTGSNADNSMTETEIDDFDYQALLDENADCIGWLKIAGTDISSPVVQGKDNEFYLYHDFQKNYAICGTLMLDNRNDIDARQEHLIIYGHQMKDGSMFRGLRNFLGDKFLKEHHILYLYLPDEGVWIFVIVKCEYTPADGDAFLLGTQEEVPTLLLSTCGTDASKRLVIWCERQEEKGGQIEYSDEEAEVQEATDDLAFLDGEFVENETHDFI